MGLVNKFLGLFNYELKKRKNLSKEYDEFIDIYNACKPYTMTSIERMYSLYKSVEYIIKNDILGDFIECGVWRGGSSMVMALALKKFGVNDRKLYLFDTFEGMSAPTENDIDCEGRAAEYLLEQAPEKTQVWCYADIDDVKRNMAKTEYPSNNISYKRKG